MLLKDSRLRVFYNVARSKSFTKAAERLCLTQQAVSFQVKSMEDELGTRLFRRSSGNVDLSEAGEILFAYADKILSLYSEAEATLAQSTGSTARKLLLGVTGNIARYCLPKLVEEFRHKHPRTHMVVKVGNSSYGLECLSKDLVDAAIVSAGPVMLESFRVVPWFRDSLILVAPASHRWRDAPAIPVEALLDEPFVMREEGSGSRKLIERFMADRGVRAENMNVALVVENNESVKAAVEAGVGVAIVSGISIQDDLASGKLIGVPIAGEAMEQDFYIVTTRRHYQNPLMTEFIEHLQNAAPLPRGENSTGPATVKKLSLAGLR